jgi:hypothetical protein
MVMQKQEHDSQYGRPSRHFAHRRLLRLFLPATSQANSAERHIPAWQAWLFVAWCGTVGAWYLAAMLGRF